jgi:hypothetical protein
MDDSFPEQLAEATSTFPNKVTAFAQFRAGVHYIDLHIQAPTIMMQFVGSVQFEADPRGILFYGSNLDDIAYFTVFYYEGHEILKTVRVDFYAFHEGHLRPLARFLARVDTSIYELPPARPGIGEGKWKRIAAATSQVDVLRQTTGTQLSLTIRPLALRVAFDTGHKGIINVPGVLHFQDIGKLKDHPEYRGRQMQADYAPSRIVFFAKNRKDVRKDYGIFIPNEPMTDLEPSQPGQEALVTWQPYNPPTARTIEACS